MEFPFTEINRGSTRWTDIDQRVRAIFSPRRCFPIFFFFPFYLPLIPLPRPPHIPSLFFLITIARSVLFVATMHNGARAAHVCLSSGGILIANRDYRAERLLRVYFQRPRISTPRFSSARARARVPREGRGGEERRKTVKSKHHVLHDDHVETRARWRREAATAGIRAVHARTLSPFPLSRLPFVILYIFITPLHHRVPMHSLHRLFFLLSFSRLSFHLRGHAHASPRLLFIDTRARPEFRNGI